MWFEGAWWHEILPSDVRLAVLPLGVQRLVDEDLERGHAVILEKVEMLDREGVDVINVGGEKVNPSEVENVIHEIPAVREVAVYGERNAILGNIVCARVSLVGESDSVDHRAVIRDIKDRCRQRLPAYKVPVKIAIVNEQLHSQRSKKLRQSVPSGAPEAES